jgi:uncharacterized membrane protein YgcG
MQKLFSRLVLLPLLAVVAMVSFGTPAYAADTWLPAFDANRHVYVDPLLTNSSAAPVNVSGLEQEVVQAGRAHNLQIFFIISQRGSENIDNAQFGVTMIDKIVRQWSGAPGFPSDNYLILTVFRLPNDVSKTARGHNPGPTLRQWGVDGAVLQGILDNNKGRLAVNDVRGYARAVMADVNARIDRNIADAERQRQQQIADAERQRQQEIADAERARQQAIADAEAAKRRAEQMETVKNVTIIVGPPVLVLLILGFLFVRSRKRRSQAEALLTSSETIVNRVGERYTELQDNCFGFLDSNKGWEDVLKNRSLAEFKAGLALYARFTQAKLALSEQFDAAKTAFDRQRNPFATGGYDEAIRLLTVAEIKVTGNELSVEQRTLFGDTVQSATYKLADLKTTMEELYNQTKSTVLGLKGAFDKTRENKGDIERLLHEVDALKPVLAENGLAFTPYQPHYDELVAQRDAFIAIMNSDPLEATDDSQAVEDGVTALRNTINQGIDIKKSLAETESVIKTAETKVATTRGQKADYVYPEAGAKAAENAPETNLLKEDKGNPDKQLAAAREALTKALALTVAGKLAEATKAKAEAEAKAAEASNLVDTILKARDFVQKEVPNVRTALGKLTREIPAGDGAVDELNAGFLKKNFEGQPAKLATAKKVKEATEAELAKVRTAFFEQRYLAARELLEAVGHDIQDARNGVVEVETCLKQLKGNREHAKATVASADDLAKSLQKKLEANKFTTSATTDDAYSRLTPNLSRQKQDVAQEITDWPAAHTASDQILAAYKAVDTAIDEQKRAYDLANTRVSEVATGVEQAVAEVNHRFIRRPAQNKLAEAQAALSQLRSDVKVAKSDWNAIVRRAEAAKGFANEVKTLSTADRTAGAAAESAIQRAEQKIEGVSGRSYSSSKSIGGSSRSFGGSVHANTSSAASTLASAQSSLRNKDYEAAKSSADSAYRAAEQAEDRAEAETAALIAAAVAVYEAEQRRIREEEERQRREEQRRRDEEAAAQRRRDDDARSSSSSSSFGGSSGSSSSDFGSSSSGSSSSNFD